MEGGAIDHAQQHGIDIISYFQVDNWAVKVADPWFIGYHCLANAPCRPNVTGGMICGKR